VGRGLPALRLAGGLLGAGLPIPPLRPTEGPPMPHRCSQSTLQGVSIRRMPSTVLAWPRGGAVCARPRPLARPGNDRRTHPLHRGRGRRSVLFINSVVGHTRRIIHLRVIRWPFGLRLAREVSGTLHTTVHIPVNETRHRPTRVARGRSEPLRITIMAEEPLEPRRETPPGDRSSGHPPLVRS
jgi:hypothetical protein